MTAYDFSFVKNSSITFDATTDSLNMGAIDASSVGVSDDADGNVVLTLGSDSVTLSGATIAQLKTSNITFGSASERSALIVGDNSTDTILDDIGTTLTEPTESVDQNNLFYGLGGADSITAGDGNNLIYGGSGLVDSTDGGDRIIVGGGSNTIISNAGDDNITDDGATPSAIGATNNIYAGLGDDTVTFDDGDNAADFLVYGNAGDDSITALSSGTVTLYGGNGVVDSTDGADTLTANGTGNVTVFGNAGDDSITTGATTNTGTVYAGTGNDTVASGGGANSSTTLYGNAGADSITSTSTGAVTIFGGSGIVDSEDGNDTLTAGTGTNTIFGNGGDDVINASGGGATTTNVIYTGAGDDTVNISGNNAATKTTVTLATGSEAINFDATGGELLTVVGFDGENDTFALDLSAGTAADLSLSAGGFLYNDTGNTGAYVAADDEAVNFSGWNFDFTSANMTVTNAGIGSASAGLILTNLFGTEATTLTGGTAGDLIISGDNGDTLVGGGGTNQMIGAAGDDVFQLTSTEGEALSGGGTISGGAGTDTLEIVTTDANVDLVDLDFTSNVTSLEVIKFADYAGSSVELGSGAETSGVKRIDASAMTGTNAITVTTTDDYDTLALTVTGGAGNDSVDIADVNGSFAVSVAGGAGDDSLTIEDKTFTVADTFDGGDGTDTLTIANAADGFTLADSVFGGISNVETLAIENAADNVTITLGATAQAAGIVTFDGSAENAGTDTISLNAADYTVGLSITGGADNDTIVSGSGDDTIVGGAGEDSITAGAGNATITGGADADDFVFNQGSAGNVLQFSAADLDLSADEFQFDISAYSSQTGLSVGNDQVVIEDSATNMDGADAVADGNFLVVNDNAGFASYDALFAAIDSTAQSAEAGFVAFYNSTSGFGEIYYDADLSDDAGEILIARISGVAGGTALASEFDGDTIANNGSADVGIDFV